ncbi:hypothetical protein PPERSA_09430 [Pseudocohnilembus persalinus]|uniref:Uncharacterized protein n=1 Tax=Pseudocohnilembus persalinus TaxID=266149 RepID=A0A0V0Q9H6_PSEPJ|nr:hypothetical protein PPERSA_09430 [Pseudocohnilembus persalinus]|eukprot:KRW98905.1 hypothetical protein PPERSA_09430 [Pseudocohnilembus persalinus]
MEKFNDLVDTKSEQIKILGKIQENTQETNGLDESEKYFSDQFDNSNKTLNQDDTKNGQTYSSDKMHKTQPCQQTNNKTQLENDQIQQQHQNYLTKKNNEQKNINENKDKVIK